MKKRILKDHKQKARRAKQKAENRPKTKSNPAVLRERELLKRASQQYGKLPYHNWQHALGAARRGMEIALQCKKEGTRINVDVVKWALIFHDAGYHENHHAKGFKTKEDYSIFIAQKEMKKMGFSPELIDAVGRAIAATHRDARFTTNEAKAVRSADLAGLAAPYAEFIRNTRNLKTEFEMMHGKKVPWSEWKKQAQKIIEFYLGQDIHLTSKYEDKSGESIFHKRARENVKKMMREVR